MTSNSAFDSKVSEYYESKLRMYGTTPKGVDWKDENAQNWRFVGQYELAMKNRLIHDNILDYGCGYGEFLTFLRSKNYKKHYSGFDISPLMIKEAKRIHEQDDKADFSTELSKTKKYEICFSSGTFNVMFTNRNDWLIDYVKPNILKMMTHATYAIVGFLNSNPSYEVENLLYIQLDEVANLLPSNIKIRDSKMIENTWEYCVLLNKISESEALQ